MTEAYLTYSQFVEMFDVGNRFDGYKSEEDEDTDAFIQILWKSVYCKSKARQEGGWCAILWKPSSEVWDTEGDSKWIRQEYNGSSKFAMWWCQVSEDD